MLLGDRVRLCGQTEGAFKDYALVGTVTSRGLAVALVAEYDQELAQVFTYPASKLVWDDVGDAWVGELPADRSRLVLP